MSTTAIPPLIALTAESGLVPPHDLAACASALQVQVTNHVAPIWHTPATVSAFPDASKIPHGYWQLAVKANLNQPGAAGYHTDKLGQPISYIQMDDGWQLTASHELIEMLVDPFGRRLVLCADPRGASFGKARVLVEACDPCEDFSYDVLGIQLSDFVEPGYYGSHRWSFGKAGPTLSYLGHIQKPLTVAKGGYLSWVAEDGNWWQFQFFGASLQTVNISAKMDAALFGGASLRGAIDLITAEARAAA